LSAGNTAEALIQRNEETQPKRTLSYLRKLAVTVLDEARQDLLQLALIAIVFLLPRFFVL
jgi:hypothetical protein